MEIKDYMEKNILAWLSYNENYEPDGGVNNRCYVYPQVLFKGKATLFEPIDPNDFPKRGSIEVRIQGGEPADALVERVGSVVKVRINNEPYTNTNVNNRYSLKYSRIHGPNSSEIWIEPFSGKGFYQILDMEYDISLIQKEKSLPVPNIHLYTTLILLRHETEFYGPFEYDIKEEIMYLHGCKEFQYTIGAYESIKYNDNLLLIEDHNGHEVLLLLPKVSLQLPAECEVSYDWISEEKLINGFLEALRTGNTYTRAQIRQIKDSALQIIKNNSEVFFSDERIDRICHLIGEMSAEDCGIQGIVQYAMDDVRLREILVRDLADNHFDLIKAKIPEYTTVQNQIEELEGRKAQIESRIKELESSSEKAEGIPDDYQEQLESIRKENETLRQNLATLQASLDEIGNAEKKIERLHIECEEYEIKRKKEKEKYEQQIIDKNDLENRFRETLENFSDKAKQTARILDNKLLDRILRSIDGDTIEDHQYSDFDVSLLHATPVDYAGIIDRVATFISEKAHREVTYNDVANYLICISQGFITTFAGEPGTGKTSLCNILAKALGLVVDTPQKRFVDVSVERGWSSHKDFIGYYNPLTKAMEKSNMEVFNAFEQMDSEYDCDQSRIAPFIILLDEANLSPMEHYWAAFLRNCDFTSVSSQSIALGGNKSFRLPEHLRFLATVNFDHTTEELSPRFLDRSWVVMLEPTRIDDDTGEDVENFEDMISFASMKVAFCAGSDDVIDETIQKKWNDIQKIFRVQGLQIMPRNLKMVKNYCAVACRCMERDIPATKFAPLDYAFSQKILPTINGTGENYRLLIEDLLKECTEQNMPISAKHLERMKRVAENNMGFFQFFSH